MNNLANPVHGSTLTPGNLVATRSFYIRFAKITLFPSINLSLPELKYYNVLEQQGFSRST